MKSKRNKRPTDPSSGVEARDEIDTIPESLGKHEIIKILKRIGEYEPVIDDILIDQFVHADTQLRKLDSFLLQSTANEYTFTRIADAKTKLSKIMNDSINQLALSRRMRLDNKTRTDLAAELQEAMLRGLRNAKEPTR